MKKLLITFLLFWIAVPASQAAITVVLDGSGANILELKNLDVDGTLYDVMLDFLLVGTPQDNQPSDVRDIFLGNPDGAAAAGAAITSAINETTAVYAEAGNPSINFPDCFPVNSASPEDCNKTFIIATEYSNACGTPSGVCGTVIGNPLFQPGFWSAVPGEGDSIDQLYFAKFAPAAAVPLPPAVFLFGSGIVALAGISRRRRGGFNSG